MQVPLPVHNMLRVPVRKRVQCRTRDLHQSLLVKLNRAQTQPQCPQRPSTPPKPLQADFSMDVVRPRSQDCRPCAAHSPMSSRASLEARPSEC